MDDLISRQAAIIHFVRASKNYECRMLDLEEITCELWKIPSAEKEIIRCKDCKHYQTNIPCVGGEYDGCAVWLDNGNEIEVKPDDFCSFAERRTDE